MPEHTSNDSAAHNAGSAHSATPQPFDAAGAAGEPTVRLRPRAAAAPDSPRSAPLVPAPLPPQHAPDWWSDPTAPFTGYLPQPAPSATPPRNQRRTLLTVGGLLTLLVMMFVAGCSVGSKGTSPTGLSGTRGANGAAPTVVVPPSAQDLQQTVINVVRTVQPSVVEVLSQGSQGQAIGSGEILSKDGYIVTNDHVVEGFSTFSVRLANNQSYPAQLVGKDPSDDLAVVKVSAQNLQPITFADSGKVQVGEFAIALGSPLGLQQSATFGIVSALGRSASEGPNGPARQLTGLIQTSAPINPGNSGGALVNLQGNLIGIPTLGAVDPQSGVAAGGIGFAIASNRVRFVADQLIKNGAVLNTAQGFIGISGEGVTPQLASAYNLPVDSGVLVTAFGNDAHGKSPAQDAGVRVNDIIVAVNGNTVATNDDLAAQLQSRTPGTQVTLTIYRGSNKQDIKVTLGERPAK